RLFLFFDLVFDEDLGDFLLFGRHLGERLVQFRRLLGLFLDDLGDLLLLEDLGLGLHDLGDDLLLLLFEDLRLFFDALGHLRGDLLVLDDLGRLLDDGDGELGGLLFVAFFLGGGDHLLGGLLLLGDDLGHLFGGFLGPFLLDGLDDAFGGGFGL